MLQRCAEGRRDRAVGRPEVAGVVNEAAVLDLLMRRPGSDGRQPPGKGRAPAAGVDDQVGVEILAGRGAHAGHAGGAAGGRLARPQPGDGCSPADVDPNRPRGRLGQHRLDHRPAPGQHLVALVAVAPAAGHLLGGVLEGVDPQGAGLLQRGGHLGQLGLDDLPPARGEHVDHPELVDAPPLPCAPGRLGRARRCSRVSLQDRHLVPVGGEQKRGRQAAGTGSHRHDPGHGREYAAQRRRQPKKTSATSTRS